MKQWIYTKQLLWLIEKLQVWLIKGNTWLDQKAHELEKQLKL